MYDERCVDLEFSIKGACNIHSVGHIFIFIYLEESRRVADNAGETRSMLHTHTHKPDYPFQKSKRKNAHTNKMNQHGWVEMFYFTTHMKPDLYFARFSFFEHPVTTNFSATTYPNNEHIIIQKYFDFPFWLKICSRQLMIRTAYIQPSCQY